MIFMGQEFLESGHFDGSTPLDWSKQTTYSGILAMYKRSHPAAPQQRRAHARAARQKRLRFPRKRDAQRSSPIVAGTRAARATTSSSSPTSAPSRSRSYNSGLPRSGAWKVRFSSNDSKYSADFPATPTADVATTATARDGFPQMGALQLGPYQVLVLSQ